MDEARLFVALDLPEAVRDALARWAAELAAGDPGLRAIRAGAMHLTLCFLGNRPIGEIDAIGAACAACAAAAEPPAFALVTGGIVGFPPRRPRALAVAIEDRSRVVHGLQASLSAALAELGVYTPERRPFTPHVTLARTRGSGRGRRAPAQPHGGAVEPPLGRVGPVSFTASTMTLLRSTPSRGGSIYEPLRSVSLS